MNLIIAGDIRGLLPWIFPCAVGVAVFSLSPPLASNLRALDS